MIRRFLLASFPFACALLVGCPGNTAPTPKADAKPMASNPIESEVKASLDLLSPEDRKLAEEQKTCPVTGEPLGSMGVPPKLTIKDQPVFICCASCRKKAESEPDKTLKAVADAKAKSVGK